MKFCTRPWEYCYIINGNKGEVWPCSWLDGISIRYGNVMDESIEEMYQSVDAQKMKESILDGSYKYCDSHKCRLLANNDLPEMSEEEIAQVTESVIPVEYNIAYDETCNHACASCRSTYFKGTEEYYSSIKKINEKMLPYYNKARKISLNGRGDLFVCKDLLEMISQLKPEREDFTLLIETNAALFDEEHWKKIEHLSKYNIQVVVTVNSFKDSTYRFLNGYANHVDTVLKNLAYIRELRREQKLANYTISMIVQEPNFRELPEYVERCLNEFEADAVRIRGIMKFSMDEQDFWFKDVFNPAHPYYREAIDILHHPIMKDNRVWFWEGDYENVRKPIEQPYLRYKDYYDILWNLIQVDEGFREIGLLDMLTKSRVAIYGAGHIGEYLLKILKQKGVGVVCVLDTYRDGNLGDCCIRKAERGVKVDDIDIIINCIPYYQETVEGLMKSLGYEGEYVCVNEIV